MKNKILKLFIIFNFLAINLTFARKIKTPNADTNIPDALENLVNGFVKVVLPIIVLAYVYVGFKFVMSQGEPEGIKKAKEALFNVTLGTVILVVGAAIYKIVSAVLN